MFKHSKTGKIYYSIDEKIKHYKDISKGKKEYKGVTKTYARQRLKELQVLQRRTFEEPELVVVNDKLFGNGINKPRLGIVVGEIDNKVEVFPLNKRKAKILILDNYLDRQLNSNSAFVSKDDLYETKCFEPVYPLTASDKKRIKDFYRFLKK